MQLYTCNSNYMHITLLMYQYLAIMVDAKLKACTKEDISINQNTSLKEARFELMDVFFRVYLLFKNYNCSTVGASR